MLFGPDKLDMCHVPDLIDPIVFVPEVKFMF